MKMCVLSLEAHAENSEFLVVTAGKTVTVLVINTITAKKKWGINEFTPHLYYMFYFNLDYLLLYF